MRRSIEEVQRRIKLKFRHSKLKEFVGVPLQNRYNWDLAKIRKIDKEKIEMAVIIGRVLVSREYTLEDAWAELVNYSETSKKKWNDRIRKNIRQLEESHREELSALKRELERGEKNV